MKPRTRAFAAALLATILCAPFTGSAQVEYESISANGQDIRKFVIADGIYQFMTIRDSYVRQLNCIVVVNADDILVFDTNTRPSSARLILAEIRKISDKPIRFIVNSHAHPDHWSGNEVFHLAYPSAEIIATEKTKQFMEATAPLWPPRFQAELKNRQAAMELEERTGKRADQSIASAAQIAQDRSNLADYANFVDEMTTLRRVFPTLIYNDTFTLLHGGREFRFISVTGDQEGTTVLYLPREKVLVTGDTVSFPIPYISPKPSLQIQSLRMLSRLDTDAIIPGHGPAFHDKEFLRLEIRLLETVSNGVAENWRKGIRSEEAMQKAVNAESLRDQFTHGDADLDARFSDRVSKLIEFSIQEQTDAR
jgi:glyoxylase-like metal-dependent hydrolase (beta-lactamase superfamily II)